MPRQKKRRAGRGVVSIAGEKVIEALIRLCGISAIIFVFSIFFFVFREAVPLFFEKPKAQTQEQAAAVERHVDDHRPAHKVFSLKEFLFSKEWYPTSQNNVRFGVLALIVGTLSVTVLAMVIAVPFGLGAAVFVSEFCGGKMKETLKIVIELLAAIPSVVWGFIGLTVMNPIIQNLFNAPIGLNVLNGAILLALMSVPIMVSHRRRLAEGRAGFVSRGGARAGRDAMATGLSGANACRQERPACGGAPRRRPRRRGNDGRADGHGPRGQHTRQHF